MTNIVMIARDRPRLTEQALATLYDNTDPEHFTLCVVDDGSRIATHQVIAKYAARKNCEVITFVKPVGIVGFLRNVGAWASERFFGRSDDLTDFVRRQHVYFTDNDMVFLSGWLHYMRAMLYYSGVKVLGGCQHPFHRTNDKRGFSSWGQVNTTDAVAGYSMLMEWNTFDKYGPFDQHAKGVCQSEDYAFCRGIVADGGLVGYSDMPQVYHCGLVNSEGQPAIGHEHIIKANGYLYE